jgi:mannose-1-phosphate guanylyltransferase/mannose-1-phosphate guanylyltransferase/mannose-6-phosphate isomerase
VTIGEKREQAEPKKEFLVRTGEQHHIEAGPEGISWLEIAFGEFDEADIIRLEDKYGRT